MAQKLTTLSPLFSTPYLTVAEYKQAPTGVDVDDFVGGGSIGLNDQELTNVIARASSWMDAHCGQVLGATQDTESFRARTSRDGFLRVHPRYWPIISIVSASFGGSPSLMSALDVSTAWLEPMAVVFSLSYGSSFSGQLQFSRVMSLTQEQFVTMTYVNGYANTVLTSTLVAATTTMNVSDTTGFQPGMSFRVYDGINSELLKVSSSFVPSTGAGAVTLSAGCAYNHAASVSVSALPPAVKQAAISMVNVILKSRGNSALVMGSLTPGQIQAHNPAVANDYEMACSLLAPYRRIR